MFDIKLSDCEEVSFIFTYENLNELGKESEFHSFGGFSGIFKDSVDRGFDWMDSTVNRNGDGTYTCELYHVEDTAFEDCWKEKGYPLYEDLIGITEFTEFYYETVYAGKDFDGYAYAEPIRILSAKFVNPDTEDEFIFDEKLLANINKFTEATHNGYKQN